MDRTKGFTLVELLAVIVILAIIMIIAIPSVISTVETARHKTMLEYYQKVVTTAERKYMEDSNFGSLPHAGSSINYYLYDIKKDLDIPSTGSFKGYVQVKKSNQGVSYMVALYDENYVLYNSTGDKDEPTVDDIFERSKLENYYKEGTAGEITNLDQITLEMLAKLNLDYTLCAHDRDDYYYEASTGRELGHTVYKPENWVTGSCKDNTFESVLNSMK